MARVKPPPLKNPRDKEKTREQAEAYARELNIDERMLPILDGHDVEILHALSPREINRVVSMMLEDRLTETKKPAFH